MKAAALPAAGEEPSAIHSTAQNVPSMLGTDPAWQTVPAASTAAGELLPVQPGAMRSPP